MIEVFVSDLAFDMATSSPVVLLRNTTGNNLLPIWIGPNEAHVIAMEISGISPKRPLTHDLMLSILNGFDAVIQKVIISSLKENTFYAKLYIVAAGKSLFEIDARPSDSIALALKMKAPIYISEELQPSLINLPPLQKNKPSEDDPPQTDLKSRLRRIDPEDFGDFNL